jgi:hypothetical protein
MTSDGGVFVRVAGASPAVKDPRVLAELYGRGVAARVSAEQRSLAAVNPGPDNRSGRRIASFGAATIRATSGPIYRKAYIDALEDLARERLQHVVKIASVERVMDHTKTWIRLKSLDDWRAEVEAHRDGSVGIHYWCPREAAMSPRHWAADPVLLGTTPARDRRGPGPRRRHGPSAPQSERAERTLFKCQPWNRLGSMG